MHSFTKQPRERYPITVDFTNVLNENEEITSSEVVVYDDESATPTGLIEDTLETTTTIITYVKSGTSGKSYKITFRAITNQSNTYEEEVFMIVEDK
jgi:hypothetical protein